MVDCPSQSGPGNMADGRTFTRAIQPVLLILLTHFMITSALQCYSCKATGKNEVDANIACLEKSILEDCDDFYTYYYEVEDQDVLSYEYYYYEKRDREAKERDKEAKERERMRNGRKMASGKLREREGRQGTVAPRRGKRQALVSSAKPEAMNKVSANKVNKDNKPSEASAKDRPTAKSKEETEYDEDQYYDYSLYGDYNYTYGEDFDEKAGVTEKPKRGNEKEVKTVDKSKQKDKGDEKETGGSVPFPTLPKDPEHYCYSTTQNNGWESYTVEKGCKKIPYCQELQANNPNWGKAWNFCCDKARCNAKQVKDKPQRIFGMGCRRTDDCIQGHTTRPVCPEFYQGCPKVSAASLKMECRMKTRPVTMKANAGKYIYQSREKKCYCSPGFIPKGPICTYSGTTVVRADTAVLATILVAMVTSMRL